MRRTTGLLLGLLAIALVAAGAYYLTIFLRTKEVTGLASRVAKSRQNYKHTVIIPDGTSLKEAFAIVRRRYLLRPDGRVLRALYEIDSFPNYEHPSITPETHWTGSAWKVTLDGHDVGSLPRLAQFDTLFSLLKKSAAARLSALNLQANGSTTTTMWKMPDVAYPKSLIARLEKLNRSSAPLEVRIEAAARILARLAVLQPDPTGFGSEMPAHALAILALAETVTHTRLYESESELAFAMGYKHSSLVTARQLSSDNPWRLFVSHEDNMLATQASNNGGATTFALYLELTRLAERQETGQWSVLAAHMQPNGLCAEGIYAQGLKLDSMTAYYRLSTALPLLTIRCMGGQAVKGKGESPATRIAALSATAQQLSEGLLIGQFEALLASQSKNLKGPFLTPSVYSAYWRETFYGGLYANFKFALEQRDVIAEAQAIAENTASASDAIYAKTLAAWEKSMIAAWHGAINPVTAVMNTKNETNLAPELKLQLVGLAIDTNSTLDKTNAEAIARTTLELDSRPAVLEPLADLLWNNLAAIRPAIRLYKMAVAESARPGYLAAWLAGYLEGDKGLLTIARDPNVSALVRANALNQIRHPEAHAQQVIRDFESTLEQASKAQSAKIYKEYLAALHRMQMPGYEVSVAYRYTHSLPTYAPSLGVVEAHVYLARAYRHDGNLKMAWQTIAPQLSSWKGDALAEGVRILRAMNHPKRAELLAQDLHDRYPDSLSLLLPLVAVQWQMKEYTKAAKTLMEWNKPQLDSHWDPEASNAFVKTFSGREKARRNALKALIKEHIKPRQMLMLVYFLAQKGDWQGAYETVLKIPAQNANSRIGQIAQAYSYLLKWKGRKKAEVWLSKQVPQRYRMLLCMYLYDVHAYSGLWQFTHLSRTSMDDHTVFNWILRAAAYLQGAKIPQDKVTELRNYFAQKIPTALIATRHMELGRYLMTNDGKLSFLDKKLSRRALTETAYYLALRAAHEGHYAQAETWLRVSVSGYFMHDGEFYWALKLLSAWGNSERSPLILRSEGRLFQPPFARPTKNSSRLLQESPVTSGT
ncbi:MAG: tetratricopeptide repeat protein [Gammaproteobacteria bacterium]